MPSTPGGIGPAFDGLVGRRLDERSRVSDYRVIGHRNGKVVIALSIGEVEVPVTGVLPAVGSTVPVHWVDGKPTVAYRNATRRGSVLFRQASGPIIEELFLAPVVPGDTATLDVWFRNDQICARLKVREALGGAANAIPAGTLVRWGQRDDMFLLRLPGMVYKIVSLGRERKTILGARLPTATLVRTETPLTLGLTFGTVTATRTFASTAATSGADHVTSGSAEGSHIVTMADATIVDEAIDEAGALVLGVRLSATASGSGTLSGTRFNNQGEACGAEGFSDSLSVTAPTEQHAAVVNATAAQVLWSSLKTAAAYVEADAPNGGVAEYEWNGHGIQAGYRLGVESEACAVFIKMASPPGGSVSLGSRTLFPLVGDGTKTGGYLDPARVGFADSLPDKTEDVVTDASAYYVCGFPLPAVSYYAITSTRTSRAITLSRTEVVDVRLIRVGAPALMRLGARGERYKAVTNTAERGLWVIDGDGTVKATLQGWTDAYAALAILDANVHHVLWRRRTTAGIVEIVVSALATGASTVIRRSADSSVDAVAAADDAVQFFDLLAPDFLYRQPSGAEAPPSALAEKFLAGWSGVGGAGLIGLNQAPTEDAALAGLGALKALAPGEDDAAAGARSFQAINDPAALASTGRYVADG